MGAEVPTRVVLGHALDRHRLLWEDRRGVEERSVMLAAVQAVADADSAWNPRGLKPDLAAKAAAMDVVHDASDATAVGIVRPDDRARRVSRAAGHDASNAVGRDPPKPLGRSNGLSGIKTLLLVGGAKQHSPSFSDADQVVGRIELPRRESIRSLDMPR